MLIVVCGSSLEGCCLLFVVVCCLLLLVVCCLVFVVRCARFENVVRGLLYVVGLWLNRNCC